MSGVVLLPISGTMPEFYTFWYYTTWYYTKWYNLDWNKTDDDMGFTCSSGTDCHNKIR